MSKTKWFHISDVLSVYTGVIMSDRNVMEAPDGTLRDLGGNDMTGYLDVVEHISGIQLRQLNEQKETVFDDQLHDAIMDTVQKTLYEQLKWLQYVEYNSDNFVGNDASAEKRRQDFINSLIVEYGEWHEVTQDKFNLVPIQKQAPRSDLPGISLN